MNTENKSLEEQICQLVSAYHINTQAFPDQVHMIGDVVRVASANLGSKPSDGLFFTPAEVYDMYVVEKANCLQYFFKVIFFDDWQQIPVEVPWYRVLPDYEATE